MKHKKILSMFLVIIMLIGMLPQVTITAFALERTKVKVVAVDFKVTDEQIKWQPVALTEGAYVGPYVTSKETYAHGTLYKYNITIKPDAGYEFNEETRIIINGKDVVPKGVGSEYLSIYYELNVVEAISVEFKDSGKPVWESEPTVVSEGAYVDQYQWNSETYSQGVIYSLDILIKPKDGYKFDEDAKVVVNGKEITSGNWSSNSITVCYDYYVETKEVVEAISVEFEDTGKPIWESEPIVVSKGAYVGQYQWDSETYSQGKIYTLRVLLKPEAGYELHERTIVRVNEEEITVGDWSTEAITVLYEYYVEDKEVVESISVEFEDTGKPIWESEPTVFSKGAYVGQYQWDSETYSQGKIYTLRVLLKPEVGYELHERTIVRVNGEEITEGDWSTEAITVYYEYYVKENDELTAVIKVDNDVTKVNVGEKVTFRGLASGGSEGYTYSFIVYNSDNDVWFRLADNIESNTYEWVAGSEGNRVFYVDVKDSEGTIVRSNAININIINEEELNVKTTVSNSEITVGDKIKLNATATGGSGNYTYSYIVYNKDAGTWFRLEDNIASNTYEWVAGSVGNRVFYVDVKDSTGKIVRSDAVNVKVTEEVSELKVSGSADLSNTAVGQKVTFTATASGGSEPYTYSYIVYNETTNQWARLADCIESNTFTWTAISEGTRIFYIDVKDSTGKIVRSNAIKVVTGKIGNLSVVGKSSSSSVDLGGTVTITGTATGENSPFTYSFIVYNHATGGWYRYAFGSSNVLTWTAMSEGTRTFYVEAKDSKGNVIRSEGINISVN